MQLSLFKVKLNIFIYGTVSQGYLLALKHMLFVLYLTHFKACNIDLVK